MRRNCSNDSEDCMQWDPSQTKKYTVFKSCHFSFSTIFFSNSSRKRTKYIYLNSIVLKSLLQLFRSDSMFSFLIFFSISFKSEYNFCH